MTKADLTEATTVLRTLLAALAKSVSGNTGVAGADFTYAVSVVEAGAPYGVAGSDLAICFARATTAGATLASMLAVYAAAVALTPNGAPGKAVVAYCAAEAVIQAGRILGTTTFTSRTDVDAALAQIDAAFDAVESAAGNSLQTAFYQALVTLHAAVIADLTTRSYPLPQIVTYSFGRTYSALALAQRLYGDASRASELAAENQTFNPAFMQRVGRALAS